MRKIAQTIAVTLWAHLFVGCGPIVPTLVPEEWAESEVEERAIPAVRVLTSPDDRLAELVVRFRGLESVSEDSATETAGRGAAPAHQLVYSVELREPRGRLEISDTLLLVTTGEGAHYSIRGHALAIRRDDEAPSASPLPPESLRAYAFPIPPELDTRRIKETTIRLGFDSVKGRLEQNVRFVRYDRPVVYRTDYPGYWDPIDDDRIYVTPMIRHQMPIMGPPKDPH